MILWVIVFVVMLILELLTVGNLVTIWFAIGALGAMGVSVLTNSLMTQAFVFLLISVISILLIRPVMAKTLRRDMVPTNADVVIGRVFEILEPITNDQWGSIMVDGSRWSCVSNDKKPIIAGAKVEVLAIAGVKLVVKEIKGG